MFFGIIGDLLHGPGEGRAQGLDSDGAASPADGRQPPERPFFRAGMLQLNHQQTVRQEHQVHVPRLALATTQLTVSHAQLLFPVAVKRFGAGPTLSVGFQNAINLPAEYGW